MLYLLLEWHQISFESTNIITGFQVEHRLKRCAECRAVNNGPGMDKSAPPLQSIRIPKEPFQQVGIDLITLKPSGGYRYVVTMVDYMTKWVEARALKTKHGPGIGKFMYDMICRYGAIDICLSDQGREFVNKSMKEFAGLTGMEQRISTAYHPQTNGLVEKQNGTTEACIQKYCTEQKNWHETLGGILYACRTNVHSSTGFTPYKLLFGKDHVSPFQRADDDKDGNPIPPSQVGTEMEMAESIEHMEEVRAAIRGKARVNCKLAQKIQARYYNKRHSHLHIPLKVGDKIWWRNAKETQRLEKGKAKRRGPFKILEVLPNGNYRVQNEYSHVIKQQCPANHAERYYGMEDLLQMEKEEEAELNRVQKIQKEYLEQERDIDEEDAKDRDADLDKYDEADIQDADAGYYSSQTSQPSDTASQVNLFEG